MVTSAYDLDLPLVDTAGMGREESLAVITEARERHWLSRTPMGFSVSRREDCVSLLRDRRFHNALSLLRELNGMEPDQVQEPRRRSILAMEGEDHARLRRLVAPAFTPAASPLTASPAPPTTTDRNALASAGGASIHGNAAKIASIRGATSS